VKAGKAMADEVEPFAGCDFRFDQPPRESTVCGADIDPGTAAIVAEIPRLFKPVLRMALEKLPHSESLSRRSPVQVCRIFVDS
jgi:hypothetical protein